MSYKPVTILTGFLGAGKTTLLNEIINNKKEIRFAIVENEIGEESIDAELIIKNKDDILEINNGCLCCTLNDNLYDIINSLWKKKAEWDEVIIEATGIADPANIAYPFLINPQIKEIFNLIRVVCVVDAQLIENQLKETQEAIKQIAFSDIILLNKSDSLKKEAISELMSTIGNINPFANVIVTTKDNFQIDALFSHERAGNFNTNPKIFKSKVGMLSLKPTPYTQNQPLMSPQSTHFRHEHSDIETILLRFIDQIEIRSLEHHLYAFLVFQAKDVYRIKGIINCANYERKVIIQSVGKSVALTMGELWADEPRENRIVIIGKQIKIQGFEKMFKSCIG